jgi:hypothetical protein
VYHYQDENFIFVVFFLLFINSQRVYGRLEGLHGPLIQKLQETANLARTNCHVLIGW